MRGAQRIRVHVLLGLSGALAGALAGFGLGVVPIPDVSWHVAVVAAALDALRVPVASIRRQVPQYWGRVLPASTVAVLYGARLGVGPLTILPTWLWWAAVLVGASRGPWTGAATGAVFAVARVLTMSFAGTRARAIDRLDGAVRLAIAAVALVAVAAACSGDGDDDRAAATTTAVSTIELEPSTTTITTPEDGALADLLLEETLPGFDLVADEVLDLDAAARLEADVDAEHALLETRGFVRGASRTWTGPDDDVVLVTAYELGSSQEADLYLVDGAETLMARSATRFDVPDLEGAFGFTTEEEEFVAHAVAFTRGARWFLVLVGSATGTRTADEVRALAVAQAGRIQ